MVPTLKVGFNLKVVHTSKEGSCFFHGDSYLEAYFKGGCYFEGGSYFEGYLKGGCYLNTVPILKVVPILKAT